MTETAATPPLESNGEPFIVRPREGRMIAGVCAGIAKRLDLDVTLVRVIAVALTLVSGIGLAAYLAAWALTPSTDRPAPIHPGGRASRVASRVPAILLIILAAIVLSALGNALWWGWGAPVGLLAFILVAALVFGTRQGRWLLASLAALIVVAIATVGIWGTHFGSRSYAVSSLTDLHSSYDYGAGRVTLDLSALDVTGRHRTNVHLGRGDVNVYVPSNVAVLVHGETGVGSVTIDGHKVTGFDAEQARVLGDGTETDLDRLDVFVTVGVGAIHFHTGTP